MRCDGWCDWFRFDVVMIDSDGDGKDDVVIVVMMVMVNDGDDDDRLSNGVDW